MKTWGLRGTRGGLNPQPPTNRALSTLDYISAVLPSCVCVQDDMLADGLVLVLRFVNVACQPTRECEKWCPHDDPHLSCLLITSFPCPARAGFAGNSYTPANEAADSTTWRHP